MELAKESKDQIIASEAFVPDLSADYAVRYNTLVCKLSSILPANRVGMIQKEIVKAKEEEESISKGQVIYPWMFHLQIPEGQLV